jgi:hypothetical protein
MVRKRSTNKSESVLDVVSPHLNLIRESTTNPKRGNMNSPDALTSAYKLFNVNRLRVELRRKGLKTSGKKSALVIFEYSRKKFLATKSLRAFPFVAFVFSFEHFLTLFIV